MIFEHSENFLALFVLLMICVLISCLGVFGDRQGLRIPVADAKVSVFIAIKSSPLHVQRRAKLRNDGCTLSYRDADMDYKFAIGQPHSAGHSMRAHVQGRTETRFEREMQAQLTQENAKYDDIIAVPVRDTYQNLPNKLFFVLLHAYYVVEAVYLVVHDDDYCLNPKAIRRALAMHLPTKDFYAGTYQWQGHEYSRMRGPKNFVAPYFSGGYGTIMSRGVLRSIVNPKSNLRNIFWADYGTSADDCLLGKWVKKSDASVQMLCVDLLRH